MCRTSSDLGFAARSLPLQKIDAYLSNPLNIVLILANERIFDYLVDNEVEMYIGRELGDRQKLRVLLIRLFECPPLVYWKACMLRHV